MSKKISLENKANDYSLSINIGVGLISAYRKTMYPLYNSLSKIGLNVKLCKFEPSCSHYSEEAIKKYGLWSGAVKGAYRILRCNPFNKGGHDSVR